MSARWSAHWFCQANAHIQSTRSLQTGCLPSALDAAKRAPQITECQHVHDFVWVLAAHLPFVGVVVALHVHSNAVPVLDDAAEDGVRHALEHAALAMLPMVAAMFPMFAPMALQRLCALMMFCIMKCTLTCELQAERKAHASPHARRQIGHPEQQDPVVHDRCARTWASCGAVIALNTWQATAERTNWRRWRAVDGACLHAGSSNGPWVTDVVLSVYCGTQIGQRLQIPLLS